MSLVVFIMSTGVVSATDWNVNPGTNIQSVVYNASANDTITVNNNNGSASNPTISSMKYTFPITACTNSTLKYMAVDNAGNQGSICNETCIFQQVPTAKLTINGTVLDPTVGHYDWAWDTCGCCVQYVYFNDPLLFELDIPLTDPVTWVSIVYKNGATANDMSEIDVVVNGNTIAQRYFFNKYAAEQVGMDDPYPYCYGGVHYADWGYPVYGYSTANQYYDLYYMRLLNLCDLLNDSNDKALIWNHILSDPNIKADDISFINQYYQYYKDNIQISLSYPGGVVNKTETLVYLNGLDITDNSDAGYECLQSFAICSGKVTDDILQNWLLLQYFFYDEGPWKATYGTFLTALLTQWKHDKVADELAPSLNVTWDRTAPSVVMTGLNYKKVYIHIPTPDMGMNIMGDNNSAISFRFLCSISLSEIEAGVLNSIGFQQYVTSTLDAVVSEISNGASYQVILGDDNKTVTITVECDDKNKIIIDLETGLVKELINDSTFLCKGAEADADAFCYHNQITDNVIFSAESALASLQNPNQIKDLTTYLLLMSGCLAWDLLPSDASYDPLTEDRINQLNNDLKDYSERVDKFKNLVSPPPKKDDLEWIIPAKLHPTTAAVLATMEAVSGLYELYLMLTNPNP